MRYLILLTLCVAACTGMEVTLTGADASGDGSPAPPCFFVAVLPNDVTATEMANSATATNLPTLPITLGGQGSWMVIPRIAAWTPWPGHLELKLWLERGNDGYPMVPPVFANVQLEQLGPLWVTPELPLVIGAPCQLLGHEIHARATMFGYGSGQNLDGRFLVSWNQSCP